MSRDQYAKAVHKFVETSAPSSPPTGIGYCYEKSDGKLYFKNSAGTEYDLTSATGGSGNGVNELQWGPNELRTSTASITPSTTFDPVVNSLLNNDSTTHVRTPLFYVPTGAIADIDGGKYHKMQVALRSGTSGLAAMFFYWFKWDESAQSASSDLSGELVTLVANQIKIVELTWDTPLDAEDQMYLIAGRNSATSSTTIQGIDSANDDIESSIDLLWIRYSTTDTLTT